MQCKVVFTHYGATGHFEGGTLAPSQVMTHGMSQHVGDILTSD